MAKVNRAYLLEAEEALQQARSRRQGLSEREAEIRRMDNGPNALRQAHGPSLLRRFCTLLADPMVLVLLAAALLSALLGEWTDSAVIAAVIALNTGLSLFQEGRAARALEALNALGAPAATVRRDGRLRRIPAGEVVLGDIVLLEAGDIVPADLRLLETFSLAADESSLTGESRPAEKSAQLPQAAAVGELPLAERSNMLFMGSPVTRGHGEGVVTATGMDTQLGRIAGLLAEKRQPPTPLQLRLAELSRILSFAVLGISALVFLFLLYRGGEGLLDAFLLAVSLAVAAVPEGLVVVVTLVLSQGMRRMSRRNAVVRRLAAVETLGAVRVICSDKTGTLTENRMQVSAACGDARLLAEACALCNSLRSSEDTVGDPTELALCRYAARRDCRRETLLASHPLLAELPFDSERKMMSTLHRWPQPGGATEAQAQPAAAGCATRQYTKGAFEQVLLCATHYLDAQGRQHRLDAAARQRFLAEAGRMADDALRVLGFAYRDGLQQPAEERLVFIGLLGLIDPPRPEAATALRETEAAGIRTVMVSGDNIATAKAIATQLGLLQPGQQAISGSELAAMPESELRLRLDKIRVYARVRPEDKLRIVRAWQEAGCSVAMTGDGVNDAPALQAADIGVGMGRSGAEVSKRVATLVLADDNFATIAQAVREGRRIYENIRKAVQFLLASNLAEVLAIFSASLFGLQLFLPIHLLWINLITDCLPAMALGAEAAEEDVMRRPPRQAAESLFADGMGSAILRQGALIALLTLASYALGSTLSATAGSTMAFLTLSAAELFHAWNMRSRHHSIFRLPQGNRLLALSMLAAFALNLLLLYLPPAAALFSLQPLPPRCLLWAAMLGFAIVPLVETEKALLNRK